MIKIMNLLLISINENGIESRIILTMLVDGIKGFIDEIKIIKII